MMALLPAASRRGSDLCAVEGFHPFDNGDSIQRCYQGHETVERFAPGFGCGCPVEEKLIDLHDIRGEREQGANRRIADSEIIDRHTATQTSQPSLLR